jgi:5,10-methylenetetrahydrofolate reductase
MSAGLANALRESTSVRSVELRPPRVELDASAGRDAWIDTYHAVRGLVRRGMFVFLTDSAVGTREEHNLRHLVINLGRDVPRDHVVPFLTAKHSLDYCLSYAEKARDEGFRSLVVLGGDRSVGPARCVDHAWQLRKLIHEHVPDLSLGGWANPHADATAQAGYLGDSQFHGDYFLTQIVSHHQRPALERFTAELARRRIDLPGLYGVFFYRSASPKTLAALRQFLPVPVDDVAAEFAEGASAEEVCARTLRALHDLGIRHFYISNLPVGRAHQTLQRILSLAGQP